MNNLSKLILFAAAYFCFLSAQAQNEVAQITGQIDPGRYGQELRANLFPEMNTGVKSENKTAQPEAAIKGAEKIHLTLNKIIITGNKRYSTSELEAIFKPYYHKNITLAKLQSLVAEVTKKYREDGYVLSLAILPPQVISAGVVKLQVIEGFISKVDLSGKTCMLECLLTHYGEQIKCSRPLQIHLLETELLLLNDLPGTSVRSVITPSKNIPGSADLTLVVDRVPVTAYSAYDNYGSRYIGPQEISAGFTVNSLFVGGDSNIVRLETVARTSELKYTEFDHIEPLGCDGGRILIGASHTETHPQFILDPLDIVGRSTLGYVDAAFPVLRTRTKNGLVHVGLNYQNVFSNILSFPFYQDRFRTAVAGASISGTDKWKGVNFASIDYEKGFDILGAHFHELQSTPRGRSKFAKFFVNLSRLQGLSERFSILASMQGQYSLQPLLATEQFGFGGPIYGRGYDYSEIIGDHGVAGKLELRMDTHPDYKIWKDVQYYLFYDAGVIWNRDTFFLPAKLSATSAGVGARITFMPHLTGNVFVGKPLTRPLNTAKLVGKNGYAGRVLFQIVVST